MRSKLFFVTLVASIGIFLCSSIMHAQGADLRVSIRCPDRASAGQELGKSIEVFVTNAGRTTASNFSVDLVLSTNTYVPVKFAIYSANFKEDVLLQGGREFVKSLGPGKTINLTLNGNNKIPADTPSGSYYLGAVVDPGNAVRESNERNNTAVCSIRITGGSPGEPKPCGIYLKSLSKTSGLPGDIFNMYGTWGPTQGTKIPCINKGTMNKLIVMSWSNNNLKVRIPNGLEPGKYRVGVYCDDLSKGKTYGSNWMDFTILSRFTTVRPIKPVKEFLTPVNVCPDPAAYQILFEMVRRFTQFKGRIRIVGVVKNVGGKDFRSNSEQASAHLYEGFPGGRFNLVAHRPFANLAKGAEIRVTYERDWNISSPAEGEFPPTYRLLIVYDPDITLDGNKDNDDCNSRNNKKERSGSEIRDLFK